MVWRQRPSLRVEHDEFTVDRKLGQLSHIGDDLREDVVVRSARSREQLHFAGHMRNEDAETVVLEFVHPAGPSKRPALQLRLRDVE